MSYDPSDDLRDFVNSNWDTNIVAKPTLIQTIDTSINKKMRRKHTANTIYFARAIEGRPTYYAFHRDRMWRVEVLVIGTTWDQCKLVMQGFEDAIHEQLDNAGRTYQYVVPVTQDISVRKPRDRWWVFYTVHMTKFAESIVT